MSFVFAFRFIKKLLTSFAKTKKPSFKLRQIIPRALKKFHRIDPLRSAVFKGSFSKLEQFLKGRKGGGNIKLTFQ